MPECVLSRFSRARLFVTLWTVARQAPLSMGFSRQECQSGLPFLPLSYLAVAVVWFFFGVGGVGFGWLGQVEEMPLIHSSTNC